MSLHFSLALPTRSDIGVGAPTVGAGEVTDGVVTVNIFFLDTKIKPAVARDGGDIKFKEFKDGVVTVQLQGSCSGCPSSTMTLKQGVQNILRHYIPDVKEVIAV